MLVATTLLEKSLLILCWTGSVSWYAKLFNLLIGELFYEFL